MAIVLQKGTGVLAGGYLNMSQQCALEVKRARNILG